MIQEGARRRHSVRDHHSIEASEMLLVFYLYPQRDSHRRTQAPQRRVAEQSRGAAAPKHDSRAVH